MVGDSMAEAPSRAERSVTAEPCRAESRCIARKPRTSGPLPSAMHSISSWPMSRGGNAASVGLLRSAEGSQKQPAVVYDTVLRRFAT